MMSVMGVAGWVAFEGQRLIHADALSLGARKQVGLWASGAEAPPAAPAWDEAHEALQAALAVTPDNPGLQEQLGDLHAVAGRRDWAEQALRAGHFGNAVSAYRKAIALRPTDSRTWAGLAAAHQGLGETGPPMQQAWKRALQLGPNEGHVQPMLLEMALATWTTATPQMQDWVSRFFDDGSESQRKALNLLADRHGLQFEPSAPGAAAPSVEKPRGTPPI